MATLSLNVVERVNVMGHRWIAFAVAVGAIFFAGCVQYEERIDLREDGSGIMEVHYRGPENTNVADDFPPSDEDELRRELEKRYVSEHVRLVGCSMEERDGDTVIDFKLEFDRLEALNRTDPLFWDANYKISVEGKRVRIERLLEVDADGGWGEPAENRFEEWLKSEISDKVLRKFRFRFEIAMPKRVLDTNANWVRGGRVAVWSYRLSDMLGRRRVVQFLVGE